jgi:transposase
VRTTEARFGFNMISAVSPRGALRFMIVDGKVNADTFIEFCKRLLHGASAPVFLIVDGHPSHKTKKVSQWIERQNEKLQLFILPGYSPDLNPDELVWNGVKITLLENSPTVTSLLCARQPRATCAHSSAALREFEPCSKSHHCDM